MPTYEYRCADCGQHVEVVQSFTDEALTECGACGGRLKKVFGSVGIVFKGSGFYKTDSRPARSGDGGGSTKTDTKADSKNSDSRSSDSKSSDSKGSDSKGSDSKSSDSKSSDSKSSDSKSSSSRGSSSDAPAKSA